jgi:hypothetical protein
VSEQAEQVRVEVLRKHAELAMTETDPQDPIAKVVVDRDVAGSVLIVSLTGEGLEDGDYEALLYDDRAASPSQRLSFSLRSADWPDTAMWRRRPRLAHDIAGEAGWSLLSASDHHEPSSLMVRSAATAGRGRDLGEPLARANASVWWTEPRPVGRGDAPAVVLTTPDPTSCLVTGAHHWMLPYGTSRSVEGECKKCGLVKRFPTTHWGAKPKRKAALAAWHGPSRVEDVDQVQTADVSWDLAFDALMHIGGGALSALEGIALQVEGSSLFVDRFLRTLEALGHIEVSRDRSTLHPQAWEVAPSTLAGLSDGSFALVGYWPLGMRARLYEAVVAQGGEVQEHPSEQAPTARVIRGLGTEAVAAAAATFDDVTVAADAARAIVSAAPRLSQLEAALPQVTMPGARRVQQFHPGSASWVTVADAHREGAYRLESFTTVDVVRRADDLLQGTARVGTVQFVKHLEALAGGRPLLAYDKSTCSLLVPLGADLPGLYGRAAVLCSGRPPSKSPTRRLLQYHQVPADIADTLFALSIS